MLKGLAITPPVIGRISIGRVVERNGKRIPEKDDEFTLTTQVQGKDGWVNHPLDKELRANAEAKLRAIPVRLMFNEPGLNFRAEYTLFDRETGRPLCVGDGQSCKRSTVDGIQSLQCPTPQGCNIGKGCKPYGRMLVRVKDDGDELGGFMFRTTGFNSIRTLTARLSYFAAISGGRLSTLPLDLVLRGKSTTQSHRAPVYYTDLVVRSGMTVTQALAKAKAWDDERRAAGFDQAALDAAAREGFSHGQFEETEEDGAEVIPEFFPAADAGAGGDDAGHDGQAQPSPPTNEERPKLPPYPPEVMAVDMPALTKMIQSGKKTPEGAIAFLSTKYTLSDDQRAAIRNINTTQQA